jgi:hypothetical protein
MIATLTRSTQLILILLLTTVIHAVETSAYAARLAGVRTSHPALARSLYNVLSLGARSAYVLSGLLLGGLTDIAVTQQNTTELLGIYRIVLLGASAGTLLAALLVPTLSRLIARGVESYEQRGSLPRVMVRATTVRGLWRMRDAWKTPDPRSVRQSRRSPLPKRLLIASILVTAIHTVSNPAALYASAIVPEGVRTASSLTPLINAFGTVLMIFVVDPIAALINDQALTRDRPLQDATHLTIWQLGARLLGTVLAQLLLQPTGAILAAFTRWLIQ